MFNVKNSQPISLRRSYSNNLRPCPYCKGFYSAANLRNHVRLFCPFGKKEPNLLVRSKSMNMKIHESASDVLRTEIFPRMNNDNISSAILFDELVIRYGNFMTMKYSSSKHHQQMIRNKIRHISRVFLEMKKTNPTLTDVTSIFDPSQFDAFIAAIHNLSGFSAGGYVTPSLGPSTVTLFTHLGNFLIAESIKRKDESLERNVERFLKLLTTTSNALVNKSANDCRTQNQRTLKIILPKKEDVKKLNDLLDSNMKEYLMGLEHNFDKKKWINLSKTVLIKLMTFNRKRPGDVEKTQLVEYGNLQMPNQEELGELGCEEMMFAKTYGRYITRGKLNSPAAVFVSKTEMKAIDILQKYRHEAGVDPTNPYLFATPKGTAEPFFKAAKALSDFCIEHNLHNKNLTATKLRKHLATETSKLDKSKQAYISDFMGHAINIHNKIYKQPPVLYDILEMGRVLRDVAGNAKNNIDAEENNSFESTLCENAQNSTQDADIMESESDAFETMNNGNIQINSNICVGKYIEESHKLPDINSISKEKNNISQRYEYSETSDASDSDYVPNLSAIEEDEEHYASTTDSVMKRSLSTPTFSGRKRSRRTWTTPERHAVKDTFKQYFDNIDLGIPSLNTCQKFVEGNAELEKRSPHQIRSWIIYEKKRINESKFCT